MEGAGQRGARSVISETRRVDARLANSARSRISLAGISRSVIVDAPSTAFYQSLHLASLRARTRALDTITKSRGSRGSDSRIRFPLSALVPLLIILHGNDRAAGNPRGRNDISIFDSVRAHLSERDIRSRRNDARRRVTSVILRRETESTFSRAKREDCR
jgi:hypothetical protein